MSSRIAASIQRPNHRLPQFDVSVAPALASAWKYSAARFRQINMAIGECLPDFVACAAVSGSLARMEAHARSDTDLIIVLDDRCRSVSKAEAGAVFNSVWGRLDALGAVRPKPDGIFSVCTRWKDLVNPSAKGRIDENMITFGQRIQLLLDAQPIKSAALFAELQKEILYWYSETRLVAMFAESGPFHWLWQDVQRYWRSLRSRTCWLNADSEEKSLALNVKLRSSRLMLVFAFLMTLRKAQANKRLLPEIIDEVIGRLRLSPAERLFGNTTNDNGMANWETVWKFLRETADSPTSELPDEVHRSLAGLAGSVEEMIAKTGRGNHSRQWFM